MKARKINLDRKLLTSEQIEAKQNFDQVLEGFKAVKPTVWKNPWFYGPVGLASIALAVTLSMTNINSNTDEKNSTLKASNFPEDTECIKPPVKDQDVDFETFNVNTKENTKIELESGTTIEIPKGSLNSNELKTTIKVRELNDQSSAFVAGIPMDYGKKEAFVSAGMIEIRSNENVKINQNKLIKVDMVLSKNPIGFGFWKLDENTKEWIEYEAAYNIPPHNEKNVESVKNKLIASIEDKKQENEVKEKELVALTAPLKQDFKLAIPENQRFDIAFNPKDFPDLEKLKDVEFEVDQKTPYDKSFTKKVWNNMKLNQKEGKYFVTFSNATEKLFLQVRPVLKGVEKAKAEESFNEKFQGYKNAVKEIEETIAKNKSAIEKNELRLEKMIAEIQSNLNVKEVSQRTTASFEVSSWGVFNCDKPSKYPKPLENEVAFVNEYKESISVKNVYLFDLKDNVRFVFGENKNHSKYEFGLFKKHDNVVFIEDLKGKMLYFKYDKDKKYDFSSFVFSDLKQKVLNLDEIRKILDESIDTV